MVGSTVSHYRIVAKLGEGGMGVVYKAEDLRLGRTVALKFLASHLLQNEDAKKRFVREAKAAAALDHPNICTLYEIDEFEGGAFMAMAYLDGQTLDAKIAGGPLALPAALDIAKQIAKGLQEAHGKGIFHRDIKPSNVCLLQTGSKELLAKILDFGLARAAGQTLLTRHDAAIGTIAYMSPEQTQGSDVDHRTDIWALGVVLYEMITGLRPFRGDYQEAIVYSITCETPEPVTALRAGVPMQFEWILAKALARDREQRYQSCVEFLVDLETVGRQLGGDASRTAVTGPRGVTRITSPASSFEGGPSSRKRRVRDVVLSLGHQGVLPDRILSQTLEVLSRPDDETDELRSRNQLLDDLTTERLRVGEFVERWHDLDSRKAEATTDAESGKKRKWKDERSKTEIFGLPLYHKAWGKHPSTGKERIAAGVFAIGNISIGVVALGRWLAIGLVAVSPISVGLWALGLLAIGLNALGPLRLSLLDLPWWQGLMLVVGLALAGGLLHSLRKSSVPGRLDELALFAFRTWKSHGAPIRSGRVIAVCGRYKVDLTDQLVADSVDIEAVAFLGVVQITAPEQRGVTITGTPILGRFSGPTSKPSRDASITIRGTAILGSVEVSHEPS